MVGTRHTKLSSMLVLSFVFILLLVPTAFSYDTSLTYESRGWSESRYNYLNYGAIGKSFSYSQGFNTSSPSQTDIISFGSNFQPTVCDADNDGYYEIFVGEGTTLRAYRGDSNGLTLLNSYTMSGSLAATVVCQELDEGHTGVEIFALGGLRAETLSWDATTGFTQRHYTNFSDTPVTQVACIGNVTGKRGACYFGDDNLKLNEILPATTGGGSTFPATGTTVTDFYHSTNRAGYKTNKPAIADFDGDGNLEVVAVTIDKTNDDGWLEAWEVVSSGLISAHDNEMFGGDGLVEFTTGTESINGMFAANLDSSGDIEVCVSGLISASNLKVQCINDDGTTYGSVTVDSTFGSGLYWHDMMYADYEGDGDNDIIVLYADGGTTLGMKVYDADTPASISLITSNTSIGTVVNADILHNYISAAKLNTGNPIDIMAFSGTIFGATTGTSSYNDNFFLNDSNCVPALIDTDNYMDVLCSKTGSTSLYLGSGATPPYVNPITLNPTKAFSGFYNYYQTVCLDEYVTFRASECLVGNFTDTAICQNTKTYTSTETTNQERMFIQGCSEGVHSGSLADADPSVGCWFNETGTRSIRIYMQDENGLTDYSVSDSTTISVVDGTDGVNCNINFVGSTEEQAAETGVVPTVNTGNFQLDQFFEDISYSQSSLKLVISVMIIIGLFIMLYQTTKSVAGGVVGAVGGLIISVVFGLLSAWILVLIVIIMVLLVLMGNFFNK